VTNRKTRLLLVREFRHPTGGNLKVRDYFYHAACHPKVEARIWFAPGSRHLETDIWSDIDPGRIVGSFDPAAHDLICINGRDWSLLPDPVDAAGIIHFVQHDGHASDPVLRAWLRRPARRLYTSQALHDRVAPFASGPSSVVPIGVDPLFVPGHSAVGRRAVAILGGKRPEFAAALAARLAALGIEATLLDGSWRVRADHVATVASSRILVALPNPYEGFYLPALEGMAAGCAVICSDAVGNRGHCIANETCLQPPFEDLDAHVQAVQLLACEHLLAARLRAGGARMARRHSMAAERAAFHALLDAAIADQDARNIAA
jgi:hypothetical protein